MESVRLLKSLRKYMVHQRNSSNCQKLYKSEKKSGRRSSFDCLIVEKKIDAANYMKNCTFQDVPLNTLIKSDCPTQFYKTIDLCPLTKLAQIFLNVCPQVKR